jgi:hypothetical protein
MHICRDSRAAVLNYYGQFDFNIRLANQDPERNNSENCPAILFNKNSDIIFLGSPLTRKLTWFQEPQPSEKLNQTSIPTCDTVVIDYKWLKTCSAKRSLIFCLLALMEAKTVYIFLGSVRRRRRHKGEILLGQCEYYHEESMRKATKLAVQNGIRQKVRDMASLFLEMSMKDRYIRVKSRQPVGVEHLVEHLARMPIPRFGFVDLSREPADVAWDRWKTKNLPTGSGRW